MINPSLSLSSVLPTRLVTVLCSFLWLCPLILSAQQNMGDSNSGSNAANQKLEEQIESEAPDQSGASYDVTKEVAKPPSEIFKVITELRDVWDVETIKQNEMDVKLRQAQVAARSKDRKEAEALYIEALNRSLSDRERYWALLQMAANYQKAGDQIKSVRNDPAYRRYFGEDSNFTGQMGSVVNNLVKAAGVYEKFVSLFEKDDLVPFVNFQLGMIYRKLGATELSIERFYHVMNTALQVRQANIPAYRDIVNEAKMEIANTHFLLNNHEKAVEFYGRLDQVDLKPAKRQEALFKHAYSLYQRESYNRARNRLEAFVKDYPGSILTPESYYLLSDIYSIQDKPAEAVNAVTTLLEDPQIQNPSDAGVWKYWQKRTANELANEFYEQNDYMSALRIYQAMWDLDKKPSWRAPVMYQIGLTFSHLEAPQQALDMFDRIVKGEFYDEDEDINNRNDEFNEIAANDRDVQLIQELAQWHAEHLSWNMKAKNRMQRLLEANTEGS